MKKKTMTLARAKHIHSDERAECTSEEFVEAHLLLIRKNILIMMPDMRSMRDRNGRFQGLMWPELRAAVTASGMQFEVKTFTPAEA